MPATASRRLLRARALCAAAAIAALPAGAVRLGDMRLHSALGAPLDATVAIAPQAADGRIGPECFRLGRARATPLLLESRATFAIESAGSVPMLRLRTVAPISEPTLQVRIIAACPGGRSRVRDYELLLDPGIARPSVAPRGPAPAGHAPGAGTRPGDTLLAIATAIYPRQAAARDAYLQALRRDNPALADIAADAPIPPGTVLVLPDLRAVARSLPPAPAGTAPRVAKPLPAPRTATPAPTAALPAPSRAPGAQAVPVERARPPSPVAPRGPGFTLRLSAPVLDLAPTRAMDERKRAQLRERLIALEADDRVAQLLALRHSVKQLEGRVAELQLKLSTLPASGAKSAATPAPPAAPAPPPLPQAAAPKPAPPAAPAPPPPKAAAPKPAAPAAPVPPPPPQKAAPTITPRAAPAAQPDAWPEIPDWLWGTLAAIAVVLGVFGWLRLRRRATAAAAAEPLPVAAAPVSELDEAEALMRGGRIEPALAQEGLDRVAAESDAALTTRVGGTDPAQLRRRYLEERFPEIAVGTIDLDDPDSVVKSARLFYEDGALSRAVELLQFAVEETPGSVKPWLALFELFRLERLSGEFGALAERFRERHGTSPQWPKVQFIGRELDPQNPLYHDAPQAHLETIGPVQAARAVPASFDPMAENWLNAPMDFTSDALATGLRTALLADAGVREEELTLDPMPALKSVEMFSVA